MARFHTAVELDSTTVKIHNGNSNQTYKKADLVVSKTHFSVYLKNKNVPTDAIVASWNEGQSFDYSFLSLTALENYLLNLIYGTAIPTHIQSFSAGVSPISFVSDGADGWDLAIVVNPPSVQLPSGATIDSVDLDCIFWQSGINTDLAIGVNYTADDTFSTGANGAGLYEIAFTYNISGGRQFQIFALIEVDATNGIIKYFKYNGVVVSNVNGLTLTVSADVAQTTSLVPTWLAFDGMSLTVIGGGLTDVVSVFTNTVTIGALFDLGTDFPDYPNTDYAVGFSISIN